MEKGNGFPAYLVYTLRREWGYSLAKMALAGVHVRMKAEVSLRMSLYLALVRKEWIDMALILGWNITRRGREREFGSH